MAIRKITYIVCLLLFATHLFAADVLIDTTGSGDFTSLADVTFNASNDYFVKCGQNDNLGDTLTIQNITATSINHMVIGAYYDDGGTVTSEDVGFSAATCGTLPIVRRGDNNSTTISIDNVDYIELEYLNIRQGTKAISITGGSIAPEIHHCNVGSDSSTFGIYTYLAGANGKVYNNTIDTEEATYSHGSGGHGGTIYDGIYLRTAGTGWAIYKNIITDWGHCGVYLSRGTDSATVYNNKITAPNQIYGHSFAIDIDSDNNVVKYNYISCPTQVQIANSANNQILYNVFDTINEQDDPGTGKGITLTPYFSGGSDTDGNLIYGNTFYNIDDSGIFIAPKWNTSLADWDPDIEVKNNQIINNIFYVNDTNDYCIEVPYNEPTIHDNLFKNNQCYVMGNTDVVNYKGTDYTITEFNALSADFDSNQTGDPLLNADMTLAQGSDAIDAGIVLNQAYDDALNSATTWSPISVVTSDQDNQGDGWEIGAYAYTGAEDPPQPTITDTTSTPLVCPNGQDPLSVTFQFTTDVAAYGRISTTDQTWDQMTSAKALTVGEGTTGPHTSTESLACGDTHDRYVAASTEVGDNGAESANTHIQVVVGAEQAPAESYPVVTHSDSSGGAQTTLYGDDSGGATVTLY